MLRLPSVHRLITSAKLALERFPAVLLAALCGAVLSWELITLPTAVSNLQPLLTRLLMTAVLGISLFFVAALLSERRSAPIWRILPIAAGAAILAAYYFSYYLNSPKVFLFRFWQFLLVAHLVVAFAPYLSPGETHGFWQFNRIIFHRILLSALYSCVIYGGLAIALLAIDQLLGIHVGSRVYYALYCAVYFIFNTWFFLAGVPQEFGTLDALSDYPAGLKIFTQYVLIPLVTLYLAILFLYMGKIIALRNWPKGTIGYLICTVSIVGMLALLLVHPLREQPGNTWIKIYSRIFHASLFPLCVMLGMALWRRVGQYGLTEERVFLAALTLWIAGIGLYFSIAKPPSIKAIPVSLAFVTLLFAGGPLSAYRLSRLNQLHRLQGRLERLGILKNGRIEKTSETVPIQEEKEISSAVDYLVNMHGTKSLQGWFKEDLSAFESKNDRRDLEFGNSSYEISPKILQLMGLHHMNRWDSTTSFYFQAQVKSQMAVAISGYDWLADFSAYGLGGRSDGRSSFDAGGSHYDLVFSSGPSVRLEQGGRILAQSDLRAWMAGVAKFSNGANVPEEQMVVPIQSPAAQACLRFKSVTGRYENGQHVLESVQGQVLVHFTNAPAIAR